MLAGMNEHSLTSVDRRLVDAARQVILDKGLARATTREISRAAGLAEGTIYVHFHDKLALFSAVLDELLPAFLRVMEPLPGRAGSRTVAENLTEVAEGAITYYRDLLPIGAAMFAEPELLAAHRARLRQEGKGPQKGHRIVADYLRAEQALGRVDPAADPEAVALLLLGACYQYAFMQHLVDPEALPLHDRPSPAAAAVTALLTSIVPEPIGTEPTS